METIHKLKLDIAEQFTQLDGSTQLYIGRESVMPGLAAWPLPHDAPYTENINRCLHAVVEVRRVFIVQMFVCWCGCVMSFFSFSSTFLLLLDEVLLIIIIIIGYL